MDSSSNRFLKWTIKVFTPANWQFLPSRTRAYLHARGSYPFAKSRFAKLASFAGTKRRISSSQIHGGRAVLYYSRKVLSRCVPFENEKFYTFINESNRDIRDVCPGNIHSMYPSQLQYRRIQTNDLPLWRFLERGQISAPAPFLESLLARNWTAFEGRQGNLEFSAVARNARALFPGKINFSLYLFLSFPLSLSLYVSLSSLRFILFY